MTKIYITAIIFSVFAIGAKQINQFPQAEISNGIIHAKLYLPDTTNGYYRGARFDWSGVMPELKYKGHTYFGQWFENYSPTLHDAIMGPVEDFLPVGYDEVEAGEPFLKIGIGILIKPDEPTYSITTPYKIANPGSWKIKKNSNSIEFTHQLNAVLYSYEYKKTVELIKGEPKMVLSHSLKNTGKLMIQTNVYDHNFFQMDAQPIGPGYVVKFPFNLSCEAQGTENYGLIKDNQIIFQKELAGNQHLYYRALQGYSNNAKDYDISIENHKTGAAVQITSDQPLSKLVFWSAPKAVCPEPYIHIRVAPGETFTWKINYQFYICDTIK